MIEAEWYSAKNILVVGGGDSAVEAAIALVRQKNNIVTVSYRRSAFVRLKEKNEKRLHDLIQARKIHVVLNSQLSEIRKDSVLIREEPGHLHTVANDYVFIFAGGELPAEMLKRAGVRLRTKEMEQLPEKEVHCFITLLIRLHVNVRTNVKVQPYLFTGSCRTRQI